MRPDTAALDAGRPSEPVSTPAAASTYLRLLNWAFVFFGSIRMLTYLPTWWAIHAGGRSDQHSLLTWGVWVGSNLSMALWLFEHNGRRPNRSVAMLAGNALMCLVTCVVILAYG